LYGCHLLGSFPRSTIIVNFLFSVNCGRILVWRVGQLRHEEVGFPYSLTLALDTSFLVLLAEEVLAGFDLIIGDVWTE